MDPQLADLMRRNLLEVFGQREAVARQEAARLIYAPDIAFTDEEGTVRGLDAVTDKAAALLARVPPDFAFTEDSPVYAGAGRAALGWRFGPPDGEPVARGVDIAIVVEGRISERLTLLAG